MGAGSRSRYSADVTFRDEGSGLDAGATSPAGRATGAKHGEELASARLLGYDVPRALCSPEVERDAILSSAGFLHAPWERVLEVQGPDAASFLHVLLTQHVKGVAVGGTVRAALANRKGHLEADLTLHRADELRFLLRLPSIAKERVGSVLESHRILEDVSFRWLHEDPDAFLVVGPEASRIASLVVPNAESAGAALVMRADEIGHGDALVTFERSRREEVEAQLREHGATPIGWGAFDRRRIERGRAWFGIDADEERLVPEPGFDDRIHYDKGCYLGQEPLARLHFRGKPNWELVRLRGTTHREPTPGASLQDGENERVGWLTSVSHTEDGSVALGYLHRRFRESGADFVSTPDGVRFIWERLVDSDA